MAGPVLSLGLEPEILLRLGDLNKAATVALANIKKIEREAAQLEREGKKLDQAQIDRLKRFEAVERQARAGIQAQNNINNAAIARNNAAGVGRRIRSNSASFGGPSFDDAIGFSDARKGFRFADNLTRAAGAASLFDQLFNRPPPPDIDEESEGLQGLKKSNAEARAKNRKSREQLANVRSGAMALTLIPGVGPVVGAIGLIGASIAEAAIDADEKKLDAAEGFKELTDFLQKTGAGDRGLNSTRAEDRARYLLREYGDPKQIIKDINKGRKKSTEGLQQAALGNLTEAQKLFDEANSKIPGSFPYRVTAVTAYLAAEQARRVDAEYTSWNRARPRLRTGD